MAQKPRVVLVGRYPPPYGGTSNHVARLAARLGDNAIQVAVADPYMGEWRLGTPGRSSERVAGFASRGIAKHVRLLSGLQVVTSGAVVHFHMSAGRRFYRAATLLLASTRHAARRVLTIHSGSWREEWQALGPLARRNARSAIGSFDDVICVNEEQRGVLAPAVGGRLHVIPAYLRPEIRLRAVPVAVQDLAGRCDVVVATSGYGTPLYDYETVVRAVEIAQRRIGGQRLGLLIATYTERQAGYWEGVMELARRASIPVVTTHDLGPEEFLAALGACRLYVRGTLADGDAVAIREAGAMGLQVVASDASPRPTGVATFRAADSEDCARRLTDALKDSGCGRLGPNEGRDTFGALLAVYGLGFWGSSYSGPGTTEEEGARYAAD